MSGRAALVAAVEADPDNDLPRLAFADFLDDAGDRVRAEFIRVQCELARVPTDALRGREAELFDALAETWPAELIGDWTPSEHAPHERGPFDQYRVHFQRGFLTSLMPDATDYVHECEALRAAGEPVLDPILWCWPRPGEPPPDWAALAGNPDLRLVGSVGGRVPGELFASPHFRRLWAVVAPHPGVVARLASSPSAFRLRRLHINPHDAPRDWDPAAVARTLADSPRFAALEWLTLDGVGFRAADWRTLAASPHLPATLTLVTPDGTVRPRSAVARLLRSRFPGPCNAAPL